MKTTIKKLLFLFIATSVLSACNPGMFNGIQGNGNVITENRTPSENFSKIKVSSGLDLYINQGNTTKVTLEADENLHEIIFTEVREGELRIYSEKNIWNADARKIYVTIKDLESIKATSGADVYSDELINTNRIYIGASSGADIRMVVQATEVQTDASSGSDIKISGETDKHNTNASSGASINAYGLQSKTVNANVSSGADINVFASESIYANASSGGDIDYKGNPKKEDRNANSGGSISKKRD